VIENDYQLCCIAKIITTKARRIAVGTPDEGSGCVTIKIKPTKFEAI
jgi:hypothetical protein